jgi:Tol biopolymer transport system component
MHLTRSDHQMRPSRLAFAAMTGQGNRAGRRVRRTIAAGVAVATAAGVTLVGGPPAQATALVPITGIVSQTPTWTNSDGIVSDVAISADGRFVAFTSNATNLVAATAGKGAVERVYVHDRWTDETRLVSHDAAGAPNTSQSRVSAITKDGSFVAFASVQQLAAADNSAYPDMYVWTRATDKVDLVSKGYNGAVSDGASGLVGGDPTAAISDDGRYVAFVSAATNLNVGTDSNGKQDIFRADRNTGTISKVTLNGAQQFNNNSFQPDMTPDGHYVVFATSATNLPGTDTNGYADVWLRDMTGLTLSKLSIGLDADANGSSLNPRISDSGNKVAFASTSSDLVAGDTNAERDVFVRNRSAGTTTRVSVHDTTGAQLADGGDDPDITGDGTGVAFTSASQAASLDTNAKVDVYLREGTTTTLESQATNFSVVSQNSYFTAVADNAVAWASVERFTQTDTDNKTDAFVRDQPFLGPFDTVTDFVAKQYERFRGTAAAVTEIDAETKLINAGASPWHFIVNLLDEPAFSGRRAPLVRLYWAYFKRRPDLGGLNFWLNRYNNGSTLVRISQEFAKSSEFKTKYGNTTSEQFVTLVYQNVLEREPESGGLSYWAKKIDAGTPRGQVMANFSESSEGKRVIGPRSDTILMALGMYGKIPSQALFDAAVSDRQNGYPREIIAAYILGAPEYQTTIV